MIVLYVLPIYNPKYITYKQYFMIDEAKHIFILKSLIEHVVRPSQEEWAAFESLVKVSKFKKQDLLIKDNQSCEKLFFVTEGYCRHFFYDLDHNEITSWFSTTGMLATDYRAFTEQTTSVFNVQAITDLICVYITFQDLQGLYDRSKIWERMGRLINQSYLSQLIERNTSMFSKTARQRYESFSKLNAELFNTVPLMHIASYLGMTLETLSRLRSGKY